MQTKEGDSLFHWIEKYNYYYYILENIVYTFKINVYKIDICHPKKECSHVFPTAMETKLMFELLITVHHSNLNHQC